MDTDKFGMGTRSLRQCQMIIQVGRLESRIVGEFCFLIFTELTLNPAFQVWGSAAKLPLCFKRSMPIYPLAVSEYPDQIVRGRKCSKPTGISYFARGIANSPSASQPILSGTNL